VTHFASPGVPLDAPAADHKCVHRYDYDRLKILISELPRYAWPADGGWTS